MSELPKIQLVELNHRGKEIIGFRFAYNSELTQLVKQLHSQWSQTNKFFYVEKHKDSYIQIAAIFGTRATLQLPPGVSVAMQPVPKKISEKDLLPALNENHKTEVQNFVKYLRSKRYSDSTISTYSEALRIFFRFFNSKPTFEITNDDLVDFNNEYIIKNKHSSSYQNQVVNAVKLYFNNILRRKLAPELIHRPKRAKVLPNVLSKEEVKLLLNSLNNIKHKAMLSLIYACGLRCGELLRLKPENVDLLRKLLIIKQSKGKKDRIVPLSNRVMALLDSYKQIHAPLTYLFEGQTAGEMYDERSLQQVLKTAVDKAGIKKPVTLHWLRHSYATHLLESGTDLRYIQEILGHSSSRTTEIYTHVSNKSIQQIVSPFDTL
jgi:integrase/recombinase XerD